MQHKSRKTAMNLILWSFFLISISEGFDKSEVYRKRRNNDALIPNILKIKYHHENQVKTSVFKKVADSTLVGASMPLWFIEDDGTTSNSHKAFHDPSHVPTFYHGELSFSAVTYFPRSQTLHGVLDQSVYIENLPLRNVNDPDLVDPFLHPIPTELESKLNPRKKRMTSGKRKYNEGVECSSRKKFRMANEKKSLYPEIFLIVDTSSRRLSPEAEDEYEKAIMYVLTYWNAVDMLFRKLRRTNIRLNIAGILIGKRQDLGMWELVNHDHIHMRDSHVFIPKDVALEDFGKYFFRSELIERDSFDFLIWMTNATLTNYDVRYHDLSEMHDLTKDYIIEATQDGCGGMHYDEVPNRQTSNRAVIMYDDDYGQFHVAARGLARLMLVFYDDAVVVHDFHLSNCLPTRPMVESSGIMDPLNKRLEGYLLWSYCSEIHFETYSRSKSSCCAINYPSRTMGLPDVPHSLSVKTQCECYRKKAPRIINYGENFCEEPLMCESKSGHRLEVAMPLDGTPCVPGGVGNRNVCNSNQCHQ